MRSLDEAIEDYTEVAEDCEKEYNENPEQLGYEERFYDCKERAENYRQIVTWLNELKQSREILNGLSHYFQTLTMKSIFEERQLDLDMRAATAEERESVKKYIENICVPTGVNFNDIIEVDKSIN